MENPEPKPAPALDYDALEAFSEWWNHHWASGQPECEYQARRRSHLDAFAAGMGYAVKQIQKPLEATGPQIVVKP